MKKTYYIFRHGLTQAVKQNRWYWTSIYSARIIEEGKPSIIRLAEYMKNIDSDFNVASPFKRCQQTAGIVTEITGKTFATDKRIGEYAFELPWTFKRRILRFIADMEKSEQKTIVICTHAIVIEMLIQYFSNGHVSLRHRLKAPLTGVLTKVQDKKVTEKDFN